MKFFHKLTIILALAGIGGLTACSDDDSGFLKRNLREMSFSYVESSNTFTIRATGDWYISDVPDSREWTGAYGWVHVDRLSGKGSPDTYQKITVTCDQNVSDERTATIYLHGCGEENVAIAIKQEPTVLFIFNLFIIILYEYVCSLIRLVHRYLSGSSIRMLLQIDTIEFKKCRCIQQFNIRMPLFQLITNPFIPGR